MTAMNYNEELKFRKHRKKHLQKLKEMVMKGDLLMILKMSREVFRIQLANQNVKYYSKNLNYESIQAVDKCQSLI